MTPVYLSTISGASSVSDPAIASALILSVKREGVGFVQVSSSPGTRAFVYASSGLITFNSGVPFNPGEKIFVLCL